MTDFAATLAPPEGRPVLVGIPEVRSSRAALDWAAAEAAARHQPLRVVCAVQWDQRVAPWHSEPDRFVEDELRRLARAAVASAIAHVRGTWPELRVDGETVDGAAGDTLVRLSATAALTVVGTRHLGAFGGMVLGSVSSEVAARASGAVVVLGGPGASPDENAAVIVGVDPYSTNECALAYAFEYAARHGRRLEAVLCWRPDPLVRAGWATAAEAPPRAHRWLSEALAGWREKYPDVRVSSGVVREHTVDGLVAAAQGQDLLVVGGGARHPHLGSLLGSVTQGVLHHATCPVAVVHPAA